VKEVLEARDDVAAIAVGTALALVVADVPRSHADEGRVRYAVQRDA
jgi:hypothetical protein